MPKTLLFDCMDTLVKDPFWTAFPEFFGKPLDALMKEVTPDAWPRFERGEMTEAQWLGAAFADGRDIDGDALKARLYEGYGYIDGIEALLAELCAVSVPMHVLSNYPVWYTMIEQKLRISQYMPWTFVSWNTGVRKPDSGAYLGPVGVLGIEAQDAIFIDDRQSNVLAAERAGLLGIVFENVPQLRADLAALGVAR